MKQYLAMAALAAVLLFPASAEAAGCIKGAIVGGVAAHLTHHSTLLGALGGCIVGHVVAHPSSSITYADVTGKLLGSDADFSKVAASPRVNIVKISTLKGYQHSDATSLKTTIDGSASVKALDSEVAANDALTAALKASGFTPVDVVAVSAGGILGGATLFVNA